MKFVREALLAEPGITMWIMIIVMTLLMQSRMLSIEQGNARCSQENAHGMDWQI